MLGPRKIPTCDDLEKGRIRLAETENFVVDLEKKTVGINENGTTIDIGTNLIYIVAP